MLPDAELIRQAARTIASCPGLYMSPKDLLEDTYLLAYAFQDEQEFMAAAAATVRAITSLVNQRVDPTPLKYNLDGWYSYHYQHHIAQGSRADCRIIFRRSADGIEVKGFGHRHIPRNLYARVAESRS